MPVLEITNEMVGPHRTVLGLQYVQSVMLWPSDEARRGEWMKAATAASVRDHINAVPAARRAADEANLISWFDLARAALPPAILEHWMEQPFVHGCQAGELLFAALQEYAERGALKLESVKHRMVLRGRAEPPFQGYALSSSHSSIEIVIWARYKSTSPFWAAYICAALLHGEPAFPATLAEFPHFLVMARLFAEAGARIPMRGQARPLLGHDRLWTIPPGLDLPPWT